MGKLKAGTPETWAKLNYDRQITAIAVTRPVGRIYSTDIELAWKIRKHQFRVGKLPGNPTAVPAIWTAVIAA